MSEENINKSTEELIHSLIHSDIYKRYVNSKLALEEHPEIKEKVNDFRRMNFQIQSSSEEIDFYEESDALILKADEIKRDSLARDFLESELGICKAIQRIHHDIARAVLDIGDFMK